MDLGDDSSPQSQTLSLPKEKTKSVKADPGSNDPETSKDSAGSRNFKLPLQCFFLIMSVGLIGTTLLGIYMAFFFRGKRWLI